MLNKLLVYEQHVKVFLLLEGHTNPTRGIKRSLIRADRAISDMDQAPSVPNLLPRRGLLNLMIWVIIDECSEPIRRPCEALSVCVTCPAGTDALKTALRSPRSRCEAGGPEGAVSPSPQSEASSPCEARGEDDGRTMRSFSARA